MTTILLGPQRFTTTLAATVKSLDVDGPVAMVNAGWEEREADDAELAALLDGRGVNLRLYQRAVDLLTEDDAVRHTILDYRARHDELRTFYGVRLEAALGAVLEVRQRSARHGLGASADRAAVQALRDVDDWYAYEMDRLVSDTVASPAVVESAHLTRHRAEVAETLAESAVVVIAGGHVGLLRELLRLFAVDLRADQPVVAWSAGAMVVCDPVVLFHDFTPHGLGAPEVHDRGLGRVPGVIALPHAKRRLRYDDRERMELFAERFPSHRLLPLEDGTAVRLYDESGPLPAGTRVLASDGTLTTVAAA